MSSDAKQAARDRLDTAVADAIKQAGRDSIVPCTVDPETWFPIQQGHRGELTQLARKLCRTCPVIHECRTWATTQPVERDGIWGGQWNGQPTHPTRPGRCRMTGPRIVIQQVNPRQNGLVAAYVTPPNSSETHRIGHLTSENLWWCSCSKGTRCKWIRAVSDNPHFEVAT